MSDFDLGPDDRSALRADARALVHRFIVTVGGDWATLGEMIESTAKEIMLRLAENRIPPDIAVGFAGVFMDEAIAEATRLRGAMASEVGQA
jgi:hypothetical protein